MRNIKLTIAYEGTRYAGWQVQAEKTPQGKIQKTTIQGEIEKALQKIFQKKVALIGSGRTDAGVHAIGQVANFKMDKPFPLEKLKQALNGLLPQDISILKVEEMHGNFHARFQAQSKIYRYIIVCSQAKTVFVHHWVYRMRFPLNVRRMRQEALCLIGRHNFKSFQASDRRERSSVTTIKGIDIKRQKGPNSFPFLNKVDLLMIDIEAKGFMRNMVRNIVGTLIEIGQGRIKRGELKKILKEKDRRFAGFCAPARGLYLTEVHYE